MHKHSDKNMQLLIFFVHERHWDLTTAHQSNKTQELYWYEGTVKSSQTFSIRSKMISS